MPGCWDRFFKCCKDTKVIFNEVVNTLKGLINQAEFFINVLAVAGVIKADDPKVVHALRILSTMDTSLELADTVVVTLDQFVPKDFKDIGDLNGDGVIDSKDLAKLLTNGQAVLGQLEKGGHISAQNAQAWRNVFVSLIDALNNKSSGLPAVTEKAFAAAKAKVGPDDLAVISARLENRLDNERYVNEVFKSRTEKLQSDDNQVLRERVRGLRGRNRELADENAFLRGQIEAYKSPTGSVLQGGYLQFVPVPAQLQQAERAATISRKH